MKLLPLLIALALLPGAPLLAAEPTALQQLLDAPEPPLSQQARAAVALANKWQSNPASRAEPVPSADGAIRFLFGAGQPTVVCAVMQVCDVELQPGEVVNSVHLGDAVRWLVEPALTGAGPNALQHLIIKPLDVGLDTSLVVTTNRRTYHLNLRSHRSEFLPRVGFIYGDEVAARWAALKQVQTQERQARTIPATGEYLGNLDFNYTLSGSAPWKPSRVYNDGTKTIIEMPREMAQTEAPTLLAIRDNGSPRGRDETTLVNYRLQGNRYIVDTVLDHAILVTGVGRGQTKITIRRGK